MTNQILERWDDIPDILEAEVCREKRVEETKNTIHGGATILMTMMVVVLCLFSFPFLKERTCGACDCWKVGSVTDWIQILPSRVCRPKGKKKKKKLENLLRWFFFLFSSSSFISLFSLFFTSASLPAAATTVKTPGRLYLKCCTGQPPTRSILKR